MSDVDELREVLRLLVEAIDRNAFDYEWAREDATPLLERARKLIDEPVHG